MDDGVDAPRAQATCRELGRGETSKRQTPSCAIATLGRIPHEPFVLPTRVFDSVHCETSSTETMAWLKEGWNAQEGEKGAWSIRIWVTKHGKRTHPKTLHPLGQPGERFKRRWGRNR